MSNQLSFTATLCAFTMTLFALMVAAGGTHIDAGLDYSATPDTLQVLAAQ